MSQSQPNLQMTKEVEAEAEVGFGHLHCPWKQLLLLAPLPLPASQPLFSYFGICGTNRTNKRPRW